MIDNVGYFDFNGCYGYELEPIHESVKSYYGKAVVRVDGDRACLRSYGSRVVHVVQDASTPSTDRGMFFIDKGAYLSRTTLRHIREFLAQHGFGILSAAEIRRLPRI